MPKSCPSFYLKGQWFRAEGFGEIQRHCPGKNLLKVEFSLQSTGPVIHMESHILGRFKQRIYFCIVTLEIIPGFSSVHQLVYICLFPVHQNSWWKKIHEWETTFSLIVPLTNTLMTVSLTDGVYFKLEIMKTVWSRWPTTGINNFCKVSNVMC